jgi:hypothetical protein
MPTAEPLLPDPSHFQVVIVTAKLKKFKLPNCVQSMAD